MPQAKRNSVTLPRYDPMRVQNELFGIGKPRDFDSDEEDEDDRGGGSAEMGLTDEDEEMELAAREASLYARAQQSGKVLTNNFTKMARRLSTGVETIRRLSNQADGDTNGNVQKEDAELLRRGVEVYEPGYCHTRLVVRCVTLGLVFGSVIWMVSWTDRTKMNNSLLNSSGEEDSMEYGEAIQMALHDLEQVCSAESISDGNTSACQKVCDPVSCCWDEGVDCLGKESNEFPSWCEMYWPCDVLVSDSVTDFQSEQLISKYEGDSPPLPNDRLSMPPSDIDRLCSEQNIDEFTGRAKCEIQCAPSKCCFNRAEKEETCYEGNEKVCNAYGICKNLIAS